MASLVPATRKRNAIHRPTLRDVATHASVSLTTVSLYLKGDIGVCSRETGERIRQAVSTLNYVRSRSGAESHFVQPPETEVTFALPPFPSPATWPLTKQPRVLGIGLPMPQNRLAPTDALSSLASPIWQGITHIAEEENYRLLTYPSHLHRSDAIEPYLDNFIGGLLLVSSYGDQRPTRLAETGLALILLSRLIDIPDRCGAVYANETDTVNTGLSYLWDLGHRRIAHLAGPVSLTIRDITSSAALTWDVPSDIAIQRLERYISWTRQHEIYDPTLVFMESSWQGDQASEALRLWMSLPAPPTAVFCASDHLALSLVIAARDMGIAVPERLSILGVDDSHIAAEHSLSSVVIPGEHIGHEAARQLLRLMSRAPASSCRVVIPIRQTATRATTCPPPSLG